MARGLISAIAIVALAVGGVGQARTPDAPAGPTYPIPSAAGSGPGFKPCRDKPIQDYMATSYGKCLAASAELMKLVSDQQNVIAATPEEAGCLGRTEVTCLATLSKFLVVSSPHSMPIDLIRTVDQDINGKALTKMVAADLFSVASADTSPLPGMAGMVLTVGAGGLVTEVYVGLPSDPVVARSKTDWDQTGVYDFTRAVLGAACVPEDRLTFYRHVDARIHGHAIASTTIDNGPSPSVSRQRTATETRCGQTTDVSSGWSDDATFGTSGGGSISFRLPGQS